MNEEVLQRVLDEAADVLIDPEAWIDVPIEDLDNKTPRELVEEGRGDEVLVLIESLKDGGYGV